MAKQSSDLSQSEESSQPESLFEWDEGNKHHILLQYPERGNTREEVEGIFRDPHFIAEFDRIDPKTDEPRYCGVGVGTEGIEKYVVFVIRNGKIRPITCYRAKRKQRDKYHETANKASGTKSEG